MARTQAKDIPEQANEQTHEKRKHPEPAPEHVKAPADESVPFAGLLGVSAMEPPLDSHAAFLGSPRFSHPANNTQKARMMTGLQGHYGNQYVQRLAESLNVQAKLALTSPDDEYEREADRVAHAVTKLPASTSQRQVDEEGLVTTRGASDIQRQAEENEGEEKKAEVEQEEEEEEPIRTKRASGQAPWIGSSLQSRIDSLKQGGQPLPESTRRYFEPKFGSSFSSVRIHDNSQAADIAKSINAKAFTTGKDIVFGAGQYSPETAEGKYLLAHELTHVAQQGASEKEKLCPIERLLMYSGGKNRAETIIAGTWAAGHPDYEEFYRVWYSKLDYKGFEIKTSGQGDNTKFTVIKTLKDGTKVNVKTNVPCTGIIAAAKSVLSTGETGVELTALRMAQHAKAYLDFVRKNYNCPTYRLYKYYYERLGALDKLRFNHKDTPMTSVHKGFSSAAKRVRPFVSFATICMSILIIIMGGAAAAGAAAGGAGLLSFDVLAGAGMTIARIGLFVKGNVKWYSADYKKWAVNYLATDVDIMRAYARQASFPLPEYAFKALGVIIKNVQW
jgi:hypothetical protein